MAAAVGTAICFGTTLPLSKFPLLSGLSNQAIFIVGPLSNHKATFVCLRHTIETSKRPPLPREFNAKGRTRIFASWYKLFLSLSTTQHPICTTVRSVNYRDGGVAH